MYKLDSINTILFVVIGGDVLNKTECGCSGGCHGRKYLTKEEKKERLQHRAECLGKELEGVKEALQELDK